MDSTRDTTAVPWSYVSPHTGKTLTITTEHHDGTRFAVVTLDGVQQFGVNPTLATDFAKALLVAAGSPDVVTRRQPKVIRTDTAIPPTLAELPDWAWTGRPAAAQAARLLGQQHGDSFWPTYDTATDLWFIEAGS